MARKFYKKKSKKKNGLKKLIKNMINKNTETKTVVNTTLGNVPLSTQGVNYPMMEVAQGVDQNQRIGNLIKVTSFRLKGILTGGTSNAISRIIIYIPSNPNTMLPVTTTVYDPIDQDAFTILSDRLVTTNANGQTLVPYNKVSLFNRGQRNGLNVRFDGAQGSDLVRNSLVVYFVSSVPHANPIAQKTSFIGYARYYFKDA